eukprot:SM000015S01261  [mRNA]  locus=s15:798817:799329:- [translate_table: standard]
MHAGNFISETSPIGNRACDDWEGVALRTSNSQLTVAPRTKLLNLRPESGQPLTRIDCSGNKKRRDDCAARSAGLSINFTKE